MQLAMDHLDDRPLDWLCHRVGAGRYAAAATAALGLGMATGLAGTGTASACLAVGIIVAADRAYALATRRFERSGHRLSEGPLAGFLEALRGEGSDDFWLVRHADGATEAMTPASFGRFVRAMAEGMRRVAMVFRDRDPVSSLDAVGESLLDAPGRLGRRLGLREAALRREAALSRAERRPMDCLLLTAWDDVELVETPAKVDPATGILSPVALPTGKGPMTQAYMAFEGGREYMVGPMPDGRFAVIDIPNFLADLAPTPGMAG